MNIRKKIVIHATFLFASVIFSVGCDFATNKPIGVSTQSLTFEGVVGQDVEAQTIWAECVDRDSTDYINEGTETVECDAKIDHEGDWIVVNPASFSGRVNVEVGIDAEGLEAGTYEGSLIVEALHYFDLKNIAVTLTLTDPETTE